MAGQTLTPTTSVVFTTTGGAGNHDTVTFGVDADVVEIINLDSDRISVMLDPGTTNPTIDGDGTITIPGGMTLYEPSKGRGHTVVKVISAAARKVALRAVNS